MSIKEARLKKGYSQAQICELLNIPLRTYKRYEIDNNNSYKASLIIEKINSLPKNSKRKSLKRIDIAIVGKEASSIAVGLALGERNKVLFVNDLKEFSDIKISDVSLLKSLEKIKRHISFKIEKTAIRYKDLIIVDDNSIVDEILDYISNNSKGSTVIITALQSFGTMDALKEKYPNVEIIYMPIFYRNGSELNDCLYPSRIVFGVSSISLKNKKAAKIIANSTFNSTDVIFMSYKEAEASKLFAEGYLAMRTAYFNELDSFALKEGFSSEKIIKSMSLDDRIGNNDNNPSFGFDGYCLPNDPSDVNSLLNNSQENVLLDIVKANKRRKQDIIDKIISEAKIRAEGRYPVIGVYKISDKKLSNYNNNAILDIVSSLKLKGVNVIIYDEFYPGATKEFDYLISGTHLIIANRMDEKLKPYSDKVFTRDIFD